MDMETPEMEKVTVEMRETMRRWIQQPDNEALKRRFAELQELYQRLFLDLTKGVAS
jgi:hypothetical protein